MNIVPLNLAVEPQQQPVLKEKFIKELDFSDSIVIAQQDALITTRIVATTSGGQNKLQLYGKSLAKVPEKFIRFGGAEIEYFIFENATDRTIDVMYLDANGEIIQTEFSIDDIEKTRVLRGEKKMFELPGEHVRVRFSY